MFAEFGLRSHECTFPKKEKEGVRRLNTINPRSEKESRKLLKQAKEREKQIRNAMQQLQQQPPKPPEYEPEPDYDPVSELEIVDDYYTHIPSLDNHYYLNTVTIADRARQLGLRGRVTFIADHGRPSPAFSLRRHPLYGAIPINSEPELVHARPEGTNIKIDIYPHELIKRSITEKNNERAISPKRYRKLLNTAVDVGLHKAREVQLDDKKELIKQYIVKNLRSVGMYASGTVVSGGAAALIHSLPYEWSLYGVAIATGVSLLTGIKAFLDSQEAIHTIRWMKHHFAPYFTRWYEFLPPVDKAMSWTSDRLHFIKKNYVMTER